MTDIKARIIGIAGTNGSGKDTVGEVLVGQGWLSISVSEDLLAPELERRGLPVERKQMAELSAEWRRQYGMGAVIDKAVELFEAKGLNGISGLVVGSLRHPGEAQRVHELGGKVVWVDANPRVRYRRIYQRGQGDKDKKTLDQFLSEQAAEMSHSGDEATLNIAAVRDMADITLQNNGSDLEVFKQAASEALEL